MIDDHDEVGEEDRFEVWLVGTAGDNDNPPSAGIAHASHMLYILYHM
jgi:hypothetical protein